MAFITKHCRSTFMYSPHTYNGPICHFYSKDYQMTLGISGCFTSFIPLWLKRVYIYHLIRAKCAFSNEVHLRTFSVNLAMSIRRLAAAHESMILRSSLEIDIVIYELDKRLSFFLRIINIYYNINPYTGSKL